MKDNKETEVRLCANTACRFNMACRLKGTKIVVLSDDQQYSCVLKQIAISSDGHCLSCEVIDE